MRDKLELVEEFWPDSEGKQLCARYHVNSDGRYEGILESWREDGEKLAVLFLINGRGDGEQFFYDRINQISG